MNERPPYELSVDVSIRSNDGYGSLRVHETVDLQARSFLEIAAVLGRFHDLGKRIRAEAELADVDQADIDMSQAVDVDQAAAEVPTVSADRASRGMANLVETMLDHFTAAAPYPSEQLLHRWARRFQEYDLR